MQKNKKIAKILLDVGCVNINFKKPFTLTSGKLSPVYVDCRKLISFPKEREIIINEMIKQIKAQYSKNIYVAGGETAGIPYAALISQKIKEPMIYIRKQPKGFGKGKLIEGEFKRNNHSILIEDMATDAGSKLHFINALRSNKLIVNDIFVAFYYGIYKNADSNLKKMKVKLNYLATWHDIISVSHDYLSSKDQKNLEDYISSIS
jgi:orotate phosphoribosyltransferase|tara:strand:+ start:6013 stop:6627 length:615 start_codon:yes stop_codon:yes gene_type:complete